MEVAKVGYGKTRRGKIDSWSSGKREGGLVGWEDIRWFRGFLERRPNLSLQRGDATANVRMEAQGIEKINISSLLKKPLKQHNLMNYPGQIYNVDETGFPLDHRPPNVIARRGQKKKVVIESLGTRSKLLLLGVLMQLVRQSLCLSYLMQNASIMTGLMKKCLLQLMAWVVVDGQIRNCFTAGWQTISWSMQLVPGHYCCCWMVTVHTITQQQFALPKNMLLCSASHHTPHESQPLNTCAFGPLKRN